MISDAHKGSIWCADWLNDIIVTGDENSTVKMWKVEDDGRELKQVMQCPKAVHLLGVNDLHIHPAGDYVTTLSLEGVLRRFSLDPKDPDSLNNSVKALEESQHTINTAVEEGHDPVWCFTMDVAGRLICGTKSGAIRIYRYGAAPGEYTLDETIDTPLTFARSIAMRTGRLAVCGAQGELAVFDAANEGSFVRRFVVSAQSSAIRPVAFNPDGTKVVTVCDTGLVRTLDAADGALIATHSGHQGALYTAAWAASGDVFATAGAAGQVMLWQASSGDLLAKLDGPPSGGVWAVKFGPERRLLVADGTGRLTIYSVASG